MFALLMLIVGMAKRGEAVQPGGPTLGEQAERALSAGDAVLAAELYEKWLEANPGDYVGWYNYACALSLTGQLQESLNALDDAATAGWRDADWPPRDPDMALIHDMPGFKRIMARIEELNELEAEGEQERRAPYYTVQTRLAPYQVILPHNYEEKGTPCPVVVLLHGRGGDMNDMDELPDRLALPGIVYLLPRAPYTIRKGVEGFAYWPRALVADNESEAYELARMYTVDWIVNVIHDAGVNLNVDTSKVAIVGYAQGASAGLLTAMKRPEMLSGMACLAGYLPIGEDSAASFTAAAEKHVQLFIAQGLRDRIVTREQGQQIRDLAREAGMQVQYLETPDDHDISDEMVVALADWLSSIFSDSEQGE